MNEIIFNLFVYVTEGFVTEIGAVHHQYGGTDEDKIRYLQRMVSADYKSAIRMPVPNRLLLSLTPENEKALSYDTFKMMMLLDQHLEVFESVFRAFHASRLPMTVVTPIVNGEPLIEEILEADPPDPKRRARIESHQLAPNYLTAYMTPNGFDFPRLLNDDFFAAIRLTFNNRHYISSMKLLMSFIDTAAYLEYGDVSCNFQKFLDKYADLTSLGLTSEELWEFRNSLLHMTNNESRKVNKGKVNRILFYVGTAPEGFPTTVDGTKYFEFMELIRVVAKAMEHWIRDMNNDRSRFPIFFERYDNTLSDIRFNMFKFEKQDIDGAD
jgi:hypothetical protein